MNANDLVNAARSVLLSDLPVRHDYFWIHHNRQRIGPLTLSQLNRLIHRAAFPCDEFTRVEANVRHLGLLTRFNLPTTSVFIPLSSIHNVAPLFPRTRPPIPSPTDPPVLTVGWAWTHCLAWIVAGLALLPLGIGAGILLWALLKKIRTRLHLYPDRIVAAQGWLTAPPRTFLWSEVSRLSMARGWFGSRRLLVDVDGFPEPLIDFPGLPQPDQVLRTARQLRQVAVDYLPPRP